MLPENKKETLKGDPETDTAGKGKGLSDHTPTLCLTESQGPGLLLTQVFKNFYRYLEPLKEKCFPRGNFVLQLPELSRRAKITP